MTSDGRLAACHCCGKVHLVAPLPPRHRARCTRCRSVIRCAVHPRAMSRTAALALAALVLYPPAMLLPVIAIEQMGVQRETTIWGGVVALLSEGHLVVGLVVLICSVVAPIAKLSALLLLSLWPAWLPRAHRAWTYRAVEFLGRWGMVDVLLVALLVAAVKLGDWVSVQPGPGVVAFASVVVLSLLAGAAFDPHAIWEDDG